MVDERRVARLLERVGRNLAYLHSRAGLDRQVIRGDADRLASLKYHFQTTIEGCMDITLHLCASEGWGPFDTNAAAMRALGEHGVLDPDLAARMAVAVGFRNLLVHQYADVDDDRVVAHLDDLPTLDAFVAAVSAWVAAQRPG